MDWILLLGIAVLGVYGGIIAWLIIATREEEPSYPPYEEPQSIRVDTLTEVVDQIGEVIAKNIVAVMAPVQMAKEYGRYVGEIEGENAVVGAAEGGGVGFIPDHERDGYMDEMYEITDPVFIEEVPGDG